MIANTLIYTVAAFAVGLVLGTTLALMRLSSVTLYRGIATVYVEFFRGIPALLFVLTVAYALPFALGFSIGSTTLKVAIALGMVLIVIILALNALAFALRHWAMRRYG